MAPVDSSTAGDAVMEDKFNEKSVGETSIKNAATKSLIRHKILVNFNLQC